MIPEVAFIDSAFENAVSPIVEGSAGPAVHPPPSDCIVSESLSSVESMDEDFASSAEVVRAVPNVKAAASLKAPSLNPNLNLSPQQKRNLAKKLRKKNRPLDYALVSIVAIVIGALEMFLPSLRLFAVGL